MEKIDLDAYFSAETQQQISTLYEETCVKYAVEIPAITIVLYVLFVFLGPKVMAHTNGFELKYLMAAWNIFLCLFSLVFFVRVALLTYPVFMEGGLLHILCMPEPRYLWTGECKVIVFGFALSKYLELVDTFFLVVRKREVKFLHWYHHTTVLAYTWFSLITGHAAGWVFGFVNSFVHVVMYFYYFYTAFFEKPFWGKYVTQLQLAQMMFGIVMTCFWDYFYFTGEDCPATHPLIGIGAGAAMYISYLYLFMMFYIERAKGSKSHVKDKAEKSQ